MNKVKANKNLTILSFLSLFSSFGTLLCCALPVLLITLGMGMTVASLTISIPWLFSLSRYKAVLFLTAGLLLGLSFYFIFIRTKQMQACDPGACETAGKYSKAMFWISLIIYSIGVGTAYLYMPLKIYFSE
jgi:mercuric ion transport protein